MAFDIGAGLAEMGKSLAQTGQVLAIEQQRANLEKEKVMLADQLAGVREEKGRVFQAGESEKQRTWQSGEGILNRASSEKVATIGAGATLGAASISAAERRETSLKLEEIRHQRALEILEKEQGFRREERKDTQRFQSGESALGRENAIRLGEISANSHLTGIDRQLAQNKPIIDAEVLAKTIKAETDKNILDARKALDEATRGGDRGKIEAARQKLYDWEYSSKDDVQQAALYQAQARLAEQVLNNEVSKLTQLQGRMETSLTPEGKAAIAAAEARVARAEREYRAAVAQSKAALERVSSSGLGGSGNRPPLSSFDRALPRGSLLNPFGNPQ